MTTYAMNAVPEALVAQQTIAPSRQSRSLSWLPAVIALPVAGIVGLITFAQVISTALDDSPAYRQPGWFGVAFLMQVGIFLLAIALVVVSRLTTRGQRALTVIGWLAVALSVATPFVCTQLAGPLH